MGWKHLQTIVWKVFQMVTKDAFSLFDKKKKKNHLFSIWIYFKTVFFFQPLLQSSVSHDPLEIILIFLVGV